MHKRTQLEKSLNDLIPTTHWTTFKTTFHGKQLATVEKQAKIAQKAAAKALTEEKNQQLALGNKTTDGDEGEEEFDADMGESHEFEASFDEDLEAELYGGGATKTKTAGRSAASAPPPAADKQTAHYDAKGKECLLPAGDEGNSKSGGGAKPSGPADADKKDGKDESQLSSKFGPPTRFVERAAPRERVSSDLKIYRAVLLPLREKELTTDDPCEEIDLDRPKMMPTGFDDAGPWEESATFAEVKKWNKSQAEMVNLYTMKRFDLEVQDNEAEFRRKMARDGNEKTFLCSRWGFD